MENKELEQKFNSEIEEYKKIIYEMLKSQTGKVILIDSNLITKGSDFDINKWEEIASKQGIQLIVNPEPTLKESIEVLQKHLSEDKSEGSYYHAWQCNITMAFKDEHSRQTDGLGSEEIGYKQDIHEIADQAAKNFLDLFIKQ